MPRAPHRRPRRSSPPRPPATSSSTPTRACCCCARCASGDQAGVEMVAIDSRPRHGRRRPVDRRRPLHRGHARASGWARSCGRPAGRTCTPCPGGAPCWPPRSGRPRRPTPAWAAGLTRPLTGEPVCGDGFAVRERRRPAPGAGLRRARARPAGRARPPRRRYARSRDAPAGSPAAVVETLHRALGAHPRRRARRRRAGPGRGRWSATPASATSPARSLGADGSRRGMVSLPGIAGHQRRQIREYDYPFAARRRRCDALRRRGRPLEPGRLPGPARAIRRRSSRRPCCATRGTRRDDAGVLVARRAVTEPPTDAADSGCGCGSSRTSSSSGSSAARWPGRSAWRTRTRSGWPPRSARSAGDARRRAATPTWRSRVARGRGTYAAGRAGASGAGRRRPARRRSWHRSAAWSTRWR